MSIDSSDKGVREDCGNNCGHHGDESKMTSGRQQGHNLKMQLIAYGPDECEELEVNEIGQIPGVIGRMPVTWVNIDGHKDELIIRQLGETFGMHHLAVEDVMNVRQRAKAEQYGKNEFIVFRMVMLKDKLMSEQLSLYLGENFVLTFQEEQTPGDSFDEVRERIRKGKGKIRMAGPDYLSYCLIDAVVDAYFPVLEAYGERLENLEEEILTSPGKTTVARIHEVKRDLHVLRRAVWPMREALSSLSRDPLPTIKEETRIYLRDCYDHSIRLLDLLETDRELCSDLMDVYLSSVSNKLNEVMKVLTIITSVFIPPTFIAGIYGMNFNWEKSPWNMPELNWYFGYPLALALMGLLAGGLVFFLWRGGWIGARDLTSK